MKMFQSVDAVSQPVVRDNSGPSLVQTADTSIRQILAIGEVCSTDNDIHVVIILFFSLFPGSFRCISYSLIPRPHAL